MSRVLKIQYRILKANLMELRRELTPTVTMENRNNPNEDAQREIYKAEKALDSCDLLEGVKNIGYKPMYF